MSQKLRKPCRNPLCPRTLKVAEKNCYCFTCRTRGLGKGNAKRKLKAIDLELLAYLDRMEKADHKRP